MENLTKKQIDKFYLGPLTKFVFLPIAILSSIFIGIYAFQKDMEGVIAGLVFLGCSVVATIISYFNDLRRNKAKVK